MRCRFQVRGLIISLSNLLEDHNCTILISIYIFIISLSNLLEDYNSAAAVTLSLSIISLSNLLEDYNQGGGKTASILIISLLKLLKDYNTIPLFKWYLKNLLPLCFCINQTFVDFFYFSAWSFTYFSISLSVKFCLGIYEY